jgi:hypothetical protein
MAERTGLEFAYAACKISKLLKIKGLPIPLNPLETPALPPTSATK